MIKVEKLKKTLEEGIKNLMSAKTRLCKNVN